MSHLTRRVRTTSAAGETQPLFLAQERPSQTHVREPAKRLGLDVSTSCHRIVDQTTTTDQC